MNQNIKLPAFCGCGVALALLAIALFVDARSVEAQPAGSGSSVIWKELEPDLSTLALPGFSPTLVAPKVHFYKSSLTRLLVKVITANELGKSRMKAESVIANTGAVLAVNANFFDTSGKPLGLIISRGLELSRVHRGGQTLSGVFQVGAQGFGVVHRDHFSPKDVIEAVQAGPRLVVDGKPTRLRSGGARSHRSGLCVDRSGNLIVFATSNWAVGVSLRELQKLLVEVECKNALNLDGGGSRQLAVTPRSSKFRLSIEGEDAVPVFLVLARNSHKIP